ncbi:uncharacterized protein LOC127456124 [Myxocyprinus asiaticus]|uniref:uncharacterized protein LOC127456124 n=1 Tax=Myxocyprinus asiaticus TaxID=70543 RepID=UPI0022227AEC|nr:uncharacterized protein LOC127456124 [Myxocyprinus asiaticus]
MLLEFKVHLQMLLAVGLAILCFCLVIGCIICWWRQKSHPSDDKQVGLFLPSLSTDHVTVTLSPAPSINTLPIKQQYEELDGEVLDYPSLNSSSTPSEDDFSFFSLPRDPTEMKGPQKSRFNLRRLSSPAVPSTPTKPAVRGRSSLPTIPKLSLVAKTRQALDRRSTGIVDNLLHSENSSQTTCDSLSSLQGALSQRHYGSRSRRNSSSHKPTPSLHFTLVFSPTEGRLTVTILGLYRGSRRLRGTTVRASLPPLCTTPLHGGPMRRRSLSLEVPPLVFHLQVKSAEELHSCTLRLEVSSRDFSGLRETSVGELELACADIDWEPDFMVTLNHQLNPFRRKKRKSQSSQDAVGDIERPVFPVRFLGQLLILLQYQTLAHRMKVMVRKAENLPKLTRMPGTPDHYVVINLCHNEKVISTKETKAASGPNAVWNAPFLFDLPAGDISQLPLVLEFIVMQGRLYTKSCILGLVLIGHEGPEVGNQHWKEMCSRSQVETARWHELLLVTP